jgi:hypothetical protein
VERRWTVCFDGKAGPEAAPASVESASGGCSAAGAARSPKSQGKAISRIRQAFPSLCHDDHAQEEDARV